MPVIHGSCLCSGVKFEITGPLSHALNCHCSKCRKQHGAAFGSRVRVQISDFKWVLGEDLVTFYESSPASFRGFCRVCGSPIINKFNSGSAYAERDPDAPSRYSVAIATLDDDPGVRPGRHTLSVAKHRGSKSPTICRNTKNLHDNRGRDQLSNQRRNFRWRCTN